MRKILDNKIIKSFRLEAKNIFGRGLSKTIKWYKQIIFK